MYLVMKSWSCSMYILVFFEYSNSIVLSLILHRLASVGGALTPRRPAAHTACAGARSVLVPRQRLERREEHRPRHPPHRHLDEHRPVHLDRVGDELADLGWLLRAPAHRAVGFGEPDEVGIVQLGPELATPVLVEVPGDVAVRVVVE